VRALGPAVVAVGLFCAVAPAQPALPGAGTLTPLTVLTFRGSTFGYRRCHFGAAGFKGAAAKAELVDVDSDEGWLRCLRITYHLPPAAGGEVPDANVMVAGLELPGNVASLRVCFLDDGSGNELALTLVDGTGERFCHGLARLAQPGWRTADVALSAAASHWGGNDDAVLDYPLRLGAITVLRGRGEAGEHGEVLIDSMEALCDLGTLPPMSLASFAAAAAAQWEAVSEGCEGGTFDHASDPAEPGRTVGRLAYRLRPQPAEGSVYAGVTAQLDEPLEAPGTLLVDLFGDASLNEVSFELVDAAGVRWRGPEPPMTVDWVGWRTVYAFTGGRTWRGITPDQEGPVGPYPLRFRSIRVQPRGPWFNDSAMEGVLLLRDLRFAPGLPDVLQTCASEMTDLRHVPPAP